MKKIITYGTFDLFHYGHYNLLKRAKELGDYLIVGVSSDQMCLEKGKVAYLSQEKRIQIISDLCFVDKVFLEKNMKQKVEDVLKYQVDTFVLGSDYEKVFPTMPEYEELVKLNCEVVFLSRTKEISTSMLKEKMLRQLELDNSIENSLHKITNKG